ncbi:hypothetical protein Ga0061079_105149 [Apibacter mensalis]|uniref:Uncharacterized protein n=1 Tax=Apibacter mensalis TaxID=1586267 RepID=A0A0X3AP79_9FLAO|nr:hypothetical protein Ga0061079_105149 [Apibacter mensalis]
MVGMSGTAAGIDGTKIGGTLFFGTVSGGFGSVLTNGNFWQGAATGLIVSGLNHIEHEIRINSINKRLEQITKGLTGEQLIEKFMNLDVGSKITGKELSKWDIKLSKAYKFIDYIQRTKEGIYLDLKFGMETASSLTPTKLKDNSKFIVEKVNYKHINYFHVKGAGTLRGDPINIYVFQNAYKLNLYDKKSWKLF